MEPDTITTYPMEAVSELADKLQEEDWSLPRGEAMEKARWIVIDVTIAVDRLRKTEADEAKPTEAELRERIKHLESELRYAAGLDED